ncbi:MAG: hypothetical protein V1899_08965 [Planctomycetota bacterium]
MPKYALKILIDLESRDDLEARQVAANLVQTRLSKIVGVRDIVLHAQADHKSIRMNPDGTFQNQWHKGSSK